MNTKGNQHYQATHTQIQKALMTLLGRYELNKISVRQICELAGINRSTFYTHYPSVYDLWAELDSMLRVGQMEYFEKAGIPLMQFLSPEGISAVLRYMQDHRSFYCGYLSLLGSPEYIRSAFDELWNANLEDHFWGHTDQEHMRRAFNFYMGGAMNLITLWLNDGCTAPIPELAQAIYSFTPQELRMADQ